MFRFYVESVMSAENTALWEIRPCACCRRENCLSFETKAFIAAKVFSWEKVLFETKGSIC